MKTIAIDFDYTLHPYTGGWLGVTPVDEPPMDGASEFVQSVLNRGYKIAIISSRCSEELGVSRIIEWLWKWMPEHAGHLETGRIIVTGQKVPAVAYVDDRAVEFNPLHPNWGQCLDKIAALERR